MFFIPSYPTSRKSTFPELLKQPYTFLVGGFRDGLIYIYIYIYSYIYIELHIYIYMVYRVYHAIRMSHRKLIARCIVSGDHAEVCSLYKKLCRDLWRHC